MRLPYDVSVYLLSNFISMGARLPDGTYISRQTAIPAADNNLRRLKQLNRLSYTVAREKPDPAALKQLLQEASSIDGYPQWAVNLAQIAAMACVCIMFGGKAGEVVCVIAIVALLQQIIRILSRPGIEPIVLNFILMFAASLLAYLLETDFGVEMPVLVITAIIMIIPGIPLVNAVRNLFCGNEINGIVQLLKINVETMALASGIALVFVVFHREGGIAEAVVYGPGNPILLIPLSCAVSLFVGITFQIAPHDLWLAGLGGGITRVCLILLTGVSDNPLFYTFFAALTASLYAELFATRRKDPSTYFIYPSILPMIPGGSFYYALIGICGSNLSMFRTNALECILSLTGMSIGFVFSSIIAHYVRKMRHIHIAKEI